MKTFIDTADKEVLDILSFLTYLRVNHIRIENPTVVNLKIFNNKIAGIFFE
jgi:hypothetical protein